ncbi:MAG: 4Fe-4S binding protein [Acetobacteraceae bacterium]|jgi:phenylglyoxylate dehydrogenase delta subunit
MHRQSHEMFDAATIPDDLSSIGTVLSPMLPGDWRNARPVVDREKCVKCAVCWVYCPAQCIVEKPRWFDIDLAACKGCGVCATECPHRAITMVEEPAQ